MKRTLTTLLVTGLALSGCANLQKKKVTSKEPTDANAPSLTAPEVRRIFVPSKIDGTRFIEGHFEYVIERNSVWSK